jgi:hypothetical protein
VAAVTLSIAVVCEAPADQRSGCTLADRVICDQIAWIESDMLDHVRRWRGFRSQDPHLLWKEVPSLAKRLRILARGHFDGRPGALEAGAVRRALLVLLASSDRVDAIVLLRDDDGETGRQTGFEQARETVETVAPVIIGLAHTKRECWVLAGFEPRNERAILAELRRDLGFDPRERAEELTAKHDHDKRSAKRVLDRITAGNVDREDEFCRIAELGARRARGQHTGLTAFLDEVRQRLMPLFALTSSR